MSTGGEFTSSLLVYIWEEIFRKSKGGETRNTNFSWHALNEEHAAATRSRIYWSGHLSKDDFDKLATGEEEANLGVNLNTWCV